VREVASRPISSTTACASTATSSALSTSHQGIPRICLDASGNELPANAGGIPGLCGQYLNIGDARVQGFELEATVKPIDGLSIDAALSLTDFEFTSINYPTTSIVVGAKRPGIGDWKWSAGIQYHRFSAGRSRRA
jgi:iron complex outermembrane receptor protein